MGRNGDGIKEASGSSYELSFAYRGVRCRERVALKPSPANLKRVTNFLGSVRLAIEKGTFDYAVSFPESKRRFQFMAHKEAGKTVKEYLSEWIESVENRLKTSTWYYYNQDVQNVLIPSIGQIALSDLKRSHVRDMLATNRASNRRLSNIQSVLRSALKKAVYDELIETNIMDGWKFYNEEAPTREDDVDPFSRDEQALILGVLEGQARNFFQFAFWTGLRTSELVALDWRDIDFVRRELAVTKAMPQVARGVAGKPKTAAGTRKVKLLGPALNALLAQKAHTFLAGNEIFQNPRTLERWSGDGPIRKTCWQYALKAVGVRYRRPYQTRHTYASMMLSAGESPMWVAAQMGHADWGMIRKTYGKFMPDAIPDAGEKAVGIYGASDLHNDNAVKKAVITGEI